MDYAAIGRLLSSLAPRTVFITFFETSCSIAVQGEKYADSPRAVRDSLQEALEAVTGNEPSKECRKCGEVKPYGMYSHDAGTGGDRTGRRPYCKLCERERVKDYDRRKKGQPPL